MHGRMHHQVLPHMHQALSQDGDERGCHFFGAGVGVLSLESARGGSAGRGAKTPPPLGGLSFSQRRLPGRNSAARPGVTWRMERGETPVRGKQRVGGEQGDWANST